MNETVKFITSMDDSLASNRSALRKVSTEAVESLASSLTATEWPMSPVKTMCHKK